METKITELKITNTLTPVLRERTCTFCGGRIKFKKSETKSHLFKPDECWYIYECIGCGKSIKSDGLIKLKEIIFIDEKTRSVYKNNPDSGCFKVKVED